MSKKTVKLAIVGAGSRGLDCYAQNARQSEYDVRFTGVAEPRDEWRERAVTDLNIPESAAFSDWREFAERPQLADAVVVATPDILHAEAAQALMRKGYHVLLEKPMATTEKDCREIINVRRETDRILAVCHVMRYSNYAKKIKELLAAGAIGDIVSIQHIEPIGYWHFAHSYVRGNWRREDQACPMLLAKSCHDLDILRYWIGKPCRRVSSHGGLMHFRRANQPRKAADRCLACPPEIESQCPYSALKIYLRDRTGNHDWPNNVLSLDTSETGIRQALEDGPYGRCVYACDNDVADHQVVNLEFVGGTTASFTVCAFTLAQGRETWIMGTRGQIRGDMQTISHTDFLTDETQAVEPMPEGEATNATGHAGDATIIFNFIRAVAEGEPSLLVSDPEVSLESHLIAFAAERARHNNSVVELSKS